MTGGSVFRAARLWTRCRHFGLARGLPKSSCPGFHLAIPEIVFIPIHVCRKTPRKSQVCGYLRTRLLVPVYLGILDNVGQNRGFPLWRAVSERAFWTAGTRD